MNVDMIIEREILSHLLEAPTSLRPVLARRPKASVYRVLADLRGRHLVVPGVKRGTWALSAEGERVARADADAPPQAPVTWPSIDLPQLALMPSGEHRALAELILLAAGVRKRYERHHASFVLFSSTGLKGKTWLGTALAHTLGADPATCVVHAGAERGAGLTARRKSTGEVAAVRKALSGPLLMIDEFARGAKSNGVLRAVEVLIHGSRTVPFEEEKLEVSCVVLLALNSPKAAITSEEATGLDGAMLRRCFAVDFSNITLDPSFAQDGEDRLERLASMDTITLPGPAAAAQEHDLRERVGDLLPALLDSPERMGSLDVVLLGQLAVEATAWVALEDAAVLVVKNACVLWQTLGWVQTDWADRLASAIGGGDVAEPVEQAPALIGMTDSGEHDWLDRVARLDEVARAHGLQDPGALARALEEGAVMRGVRGPDRRALLEALDEAAIGARSMIAVIEIMRGLGLSSAQAARLIDEAHALAVHADLGDLLEMARTLHALGEAPGDVARWMTQVAERSGSFVDAVVQAEAEVADAEARAAAAQDEAEYAANRVLRMTALVEDVQRDPSLRSWLRGADDRAAWEAGERVAGRAGRA